MEGVVLQAVHFGGASFVLVAVLGIIASGFQFAFRNLFLLDLTRVFIHFIFIPIGSLLYTIKPLPGYNYATVSGMIRLSVGVALLAVGCSGLVIGSLEISSHVPVDKIDLLSRMVVYSLSLGLGLSVVPFGN